MNATTMSLSLANKVMGGTGNSTIDSEGPLGIMQIRLKTLQQGRNISGFGILYGSSKNHLLYGSSETLNSFPYGIAIKNLIWFKFMPLFLSVGTGSDYRQERL
jgi:hypothetical protein